MFVFFSPAHHDAAGMEDLLYEFYGLAIICSITYASDTTS